MRIQGLRGLAARIDAAGASRKKWSAGRLEGQSLPVGELLQELQRRPLFDVSTLICPIELSCAVPEADAPAQRAMLEALLDWTLRLGGRGELAEFTLDGEVRCFLWEGKKRALPVAHSDRRVKTDFVMLQKHRREAALKYVPRKTTVLRCACGTATAPTAVACSSCKRDFTAPIGIESRPENDESLRLLRTRLVKLNIPLPKNDVFLANVFQPRNAFEALTYEELLPRFEFETTDPRELRRRIELLTEVETWPKRYSPPGLLDESSFASWCASLRTLTKPSARKPLERMAREQGHRFKEIAAVAPWAPGWLAARDVSGSSVPGSYRFEQVKQALDFLWRLAGGKVALSAEFLGVLQHIAPDLVTAKEQKLHEQELDRRALSDGTGFGDYLKRRSAKAKSQAHALAAVLTEAGSPDAKGSAPSARVNLARAVVEWLVEGRRPELKDVEGDWLVEQLETLKRAKRLPKAILESAERARLHPAPFGLTGARCWDVQPGRLSAADLKARAACPECNRRVKPSRVLHIPSLDAGMEARTVHLYECEPCDKSLLFARAVKPARAPKTPARVFVEYRDAAALKKPFPKGFVPWRYERFLTRQHEGHPLALQIGGLPLLPEEHDPALDMDLRCGHPFVRVRIHTRALDLQPGFGGGAVVGGVCLTPGCKKPDVRNVRDD